MGFFKDLKRTVDKSNELRDQMPSTKDQMAAGIESMKAMNAQMAAMNAALDPSAPSTTVDATVVSVRDTGAQLNYQPMLEVALLVPAATGATYPVTVSQPVPLSSLARVQPGASVPVRVRLDDPQAVYLIV